MVQSSDETALAILKRIQESVSCAICNNLITNPMRNPCGHRFCYYCIVNALEPTEDICNCPKCNAAVNRNRLIQDICFGKVVNKASQLIDSMRGSDLSDKPNGNKDNSPHGKRRLPQDRHEEIDLDKSIEEAEAEAREMARDVVKKGTKRTLEDEAVEAVKRPFAVPKTSTPSGSGKERELSPFPVSFLNKFTLQPDKRPSDKQASPSPKRPREPLNRKLSFEGEDRRESLMSDSSDSEDRRIRSGATYSRFDRVRQSLKKNNGAQTEILMSQRKNQFQQTDGTNNSDLYSTLTNLFNCLCTQHGIQGAITIEGIGRFEINLSKPTEDGLKNGQPDQSHVAIMVDKFAQTETEPIKKKPILKESGVNTLKTLTQENEVQTDPICDNIERPASPHEEQNLNNSHISTIGPEEIEVNVNGIVKEHHDRLGEIEVSHEVTSISQIVKEFSEDPVNSQEDGDLTRYDHIKASTRISQLGKISESDAEATEVISKANITSDTKDQEESDIEDDRPTKEGDEDSNIVLESDEDDKFLMSCVFDTLNDDDDDELESVRSMSSTSTPVKATTKNIYLNKSVAKEDSVLNETRSHLNDTLEY